MTTSADTSEVLVSVLLDKYLEVVMLNHMVVFFVIF